MLREVAVIAVSIIKHAISKQPEGRNDPITGERISVQYSVHNNYVFMRTLRTHCKDSPQLNAAITKFEHNFGLNLTRINHTRRLHWNMLVCLCKHLEEPIMTCSAAAVRRFLEFRMGQISEKDRTVAYLRALDSRVATVFGYLGRKCKHSATNIVVLATTDPRNPVHS
jgi:hypothetical protein